MGNKIDIEALAVLSKLYFDDECIEKMELDMREMLSVCESLSEIETREFSDRSIKLSMLREDTASEDTYERDALLCASPLVKDGAVVVGRVLEAEE